MHAVQMQDVSLRLWLHACHGSCRNHRGANPVSAFDQKMEVCCLLLPKLVASFGKPIESMKPMFKLQLCPIWSKDVTVCCYHYQM